MGNSLYEPDLKDTANEILTFSKQNNCNILLPVDIITANKLEKILKQIHQIMMNALQTK